jgi:hypothetical protein
MTAQQRIGAIRAILVDPTARTVSAIELPLYTGDECCGDQIDLRDGRGHRAAGHLVAQDRPRV